MFKKLVLIVFIIFPSFLLSEITDKQKKEYEELMNNYDLKGPSELYIITANCDKKHIDKIESNLKGEEIRIIDYHYTLWLMVSEHKISKVEISNFDFSEEVKSCIEQETLNSVNAPTLPNYGTIPIIVKFPAFITKK
ncbi:hypothetical protein [Sulfurospirillum arsenophilum]|uniref:hypothetical protein n=1 Tax=Sulfurospirillum arsenophilum TaxID=56698 RepID=UPI0005AAAA73|nr:hypothetical protein [Sulfurospirillum arsenophilum]